MTRSASGAVIPDACSDVSPDCIERKISMKKNRCFKLTALLLAAAMVIGAVPAFADGAQSGGFSIEVTLNTAELDSTFVQSAAVTDADGQTVADPGTADPNGSYTLKLAVSEPENADNTEETLPESTDLVRLYYPLAGMRAEDGGNDDVTWTFDAAAKQLVFKWKNGKKASFSADISVIPDTPAANDLSGSYLLVTRNRKSVVDDKAWKGGNGRINALAYSEKNGLAFFDSVTVPVWVFTHVSGDYYTIRSRNTGAYMRISGNSASLENTDEASAQKLLVKATGNAYYITAGETGLNNYNLKTEDGFGAWKTGNGDNEKFFLVSESSVATAPTKDISGEWAVTFANSRKYLLAADAAGAVKTVAYITNNDNHGIFPGDNVSYWTFEHVVRDWYTVRTDAGYLNISESGLAVSGTPQNILARFNGNNVFLTSAEDNATAYTVQCRDQNGMGVVKGTTQYSDQTRITLQAKELVADGPAGLNGRFALINEKTGGAAVAETIDGTKIKSVPYYRTESGKAFSPEGQIASWTFTQKDGSWYTLQADNGKYLEITGSGVRLSDTEAPVLIQEFNGQYRFTNGTARALNNLGGNSRGGYGAYDKGEGKDKSEWFTLTSAVSPDSTVLAFDANNGKDGTLPAAKEVQPGAAVTLPGYDGTKNGTAFIGWSKDNNIYNNVEGKNNTYREIYQPGDTYRVGEGAEKLYAVFNEKPATANFYIRKDGTIPDEPGDYPKSAYTKEIVVEDTVKIGKWFVDVEAGKPVEGNHVANAVTANLKAFPTDEQIKALVADYDPETMYVHWYVLKYAGSWHVDGVIRKRAGNSIAYSTNVEGEQKNEVKNMPLGFQMTAGEENVTAGADSKGQVLTPTMEGYTFEGWNTEKDGSGTAYASGENITADGDVTLYAQWDDILTVTVHSNHEGQDSVYVGTEIILTAERGGSYTGNVDIRWEREDPDTGERTVIEGENTMEYRFIINEENAKYRYFIILTPVE